MYSKGKQKSLQPPSAPISDDEEQDSEDESEMSEEEKLLESSSSEAEQEVECTEWDNDCKVIPKTTSSLVGYHLMPTCERFIESPPNKKRKIAPEISSELTKPDFKNSFIKNWENRETFIQDNVELVVDPFKLCIINNFIQNESFLDSLRKEFYELDWNQRNMDLYEFFQSKDLKYLSSECLKSFFEFLKRDVMQWVSELTKFNLTHTSATCSIYSNTDYLLVHDDQREDRMVAFILYLTGPEDWDESKGGALQLFNKDERGHPQNVVRNIFPANNQFVFFPVTDDSYHQVAEVTSLESCRLSINGWFHVKIPPVFNTPIYEPLNGLFSKKSLKAKVVDIDLESWISDDYLNVNTAFYIQKQIEGNSEISLSKFFKEESFSEILQTLQSKDISWNRVGPPNRYCYETINLETLPHILERFLNLFQSAQMFSLLQKYTDLELEDENASMKFELQRWTPGCYSLLTEYDWQEKNELDLIMYFGCSQSSDTLGARTQYVTVEDEIQNALITLEPEDNSLNIVYRDSARFTKYYSKQSKCQCFFTLICSYSE